MISDEEALRRDDPGTAGSDDLEALGDGLRTVCNGSDRLGATAFVDALDTGHLCGGKGRRIDAPVGTGRRHDDDVLHASDLGGNAAHDHRARKGALAAGDVAGNGRNGVVALAGIGAGRHFVEPHLFRFLRDVEFADVLRGEGDGVHHIAFE